MTSSICQLRQLAYSLNQNMHLIYTLSEGLKKFVQSICTEALRHNPLIHMYRKRTPHLGTQWEVEHILGVPGILSGGKYFNNIDIRFFRSASLATVPFRKTFFFKLLLWCLDQIDNLLLRVPIVRRMAWVAVIVYSEPRILKRA